VAQIWNATGLYSFGAELTVAPTPLLGDHGQKGIDTVGNIMKEKNRARHETLAQS
jgi:hypothetical protein